MCDDITNRGVYLRSENQYKKNLENNKADFINTVKKIVDLSDTNDRLERSKNEIRNKIKVERRNGNNSKIGTYIDKISKIDKEVKKNELRMKLECELRQKEHSYQIR